MNGAIRTSGRWTVGLTGGFQKQASSVKPTKPALPAKNALLHGESATTPSTSTASVVG